MNKRLYITLAITFAVMFILYFAGPFWAIMFLTGLALMHASINVGRKL